MQLDYEAARNELFSQLLTVESEIINLIGYCRIVYQGLESVGKIPTDEFWLRVSQQTALEGQATIAGNDLKRRYDTNGLIFVQIFISKTKPSNYQNGVKLANIVKTAFRGKETENCIWFRNARIQELPAESAWHRINVVAEYQYQEIG